MVDDKYISTLQCPEGALRLNQFFLFTHKMQPLCRLLLLPHGTLLTRQPGNITFYHFTPMKQTYYFSISHRPQDWLLIYQCLLCSRMRAPTEKFNYTQKSVAFWICHRAYCVGTSHHSCHLKLSPQHLQSIQLQESKQGHVLALISSSSNALRPATLIPDICLIL